VLFDSPLGASGARQNHITLNCRFSDANQTDALALPQEYGTAAKEPKTIGGHRASTSLRFTSQDTAPSRHFRSASSRAYAVRPWS
jgi:hypothetical protein